MCLRLTWCLVLAWAADASALEILDDQGRAVRLDRPAARVVALYGAFNEMLAGMGLEDRIVARTAADTEPPSIRTKPSIGTHMRPNLELILAQKPDLVLQMIGRAEAGEIPAALERYGVPTALFKVACFADLFSVYERLGVLMGAETEAAAAIASGRAGWNGWNGRMPACPEPGPFLKCGTPTCSARARGPSSRISSDSPGAKTRCFRIRNWCA